MRTFFEGSYYILGFGIEVSRNSCSTFQALGLSGRGFRVNGFSVACSSFTVQVSHWFRLLSGCMRDCWTPGIGLN